MGAAAALSDDPRDGPRSGARRSWLHVGGGLAAAAGDEQDGQRRDDGPSGADEEGDLEAGVLGKPARQDVRGDDAATDLGADGGTDVAHDRVDAGGLTGLTVGDRGDDEVGDRREGGTGADAHQTAPEDDEADGVVGERQAEQRAGDDQAAGEERRLGAAALADAADKGRDQEGGEPAGGEQEAGPGGRQPEADLTALGKLA